MASLQTIQDYLTLCKPKTVALILMTSWIGMLLSTTSRLAWRSILLATLGIGCAASSAAIVNHFIERKSDPNMARTANRPLAQARISTRGALYFAVILNGLSMLILYYGCNPLTAYLTFATFVLYAIFYTRFLKRITPQSIVIGGLAGAMPPLLGWTAMSNQIHAFTLIPVLIIFAWTPPHFWALSIYRYRDYQNIKLPTLPNTHGIAFTKFCILLYSILLILTSLLPFITWMSSTLYLILAISLNIFFLRSVLQLYRSQDPKQGLKTFQDSILYLLLIFLSLLVDRLFITGGFKPW